MGSRFPGGASSGTILFFQSLPLTSTTPSGHISGLTGVQMKSGFFSVLAKTIAGLAVILVSFFGTLWVLSLWDSRLQTLQVLRLENNGVALIKKTIPSDAANARPSDGATILRAKFVPRDPTSTVRV